MTRAGSHHGRLLALVAAVVVLFAGLVGRLGQVQLAGADGFAAEATTLDTRTILVPALRGRILDRAGRPLADNRTATVVTLERRVIAGSPDHAEAEVRAAAALLGLPADDLVGRTWLCGEGGAPAAPACWSGSPQVPVPLAEDADPHRALSLVEQPARFPGMAVSSRPVRVYPRPDGISAAHVIGYLGPATRQEVEASTSLVADDLVGRAGLEKQYDDVLRGSPGRTVVSVDARGLVTGVVSRSDPVPGRDLVTSLDAVVQASAEKALAGAMASARARAEKWPADAGGAIVMDARTGAVAAVASAPTYDPNVWTGGISTADYSALTAAGAGNPLLSRVTGVGLPPGSTIKPSSVAAAVLAGDSLGGRYGCPAEYMIGDRVFRNHETRDQGEISLARAIEISCDTVFYDVAYRAWQAEGGLRARADTADPFVEAARGFGLGSATGIDLPDETGGRVPDRAWRKATWEATRHDLCARAAHGYPEVPDAKRRTFLTEVARENCESGWQLRAGDAANFSIGQGDVLATPVQMAVMYAAVANGGTVLTPRVGAATVDPVSGERTPVAAGPRRAAPVSRALDAYLRTALRGVVTRGTAVSAFRGQPADWPVAGKTGTAEAVGKRDTSWFVSYAPADHPRWVVAVVVSQGGSGGTSAAPAARQVLRTLRGLR